MGEGRGWWGGRRVNEGMGDLGGVETLDVTTELKGGAVKRRKRKGRLHKKGGRLKRALPLSNEKKKVGLRKWAVLSFKVVGSRRGKGKGSGRPL